MSCTRPLQAFVCGTDSRGKKIIKFANFKEQNIFWYDGKPYYEKIEIPCGQCVACRLQYSRQWADRCMMELEDHDSAWFLTLTYEVPPESWYGDDITGEAHCAYTLKKKDLQDFWKRLRDHFPDDKIRYFACGEYGDNTLRPHYHAIVYGLHLNDLCYYKRSNLSDIYFNSDELNKVWKHGYVVIGKVSWKSCAYVARYVMKKAKGATADKWKKFNCEPEFVCMSRKPGIGRSYYEKNKDKLYDYLSIYLSTENGSVQCKVPRYFNQLTEKIYEDDSLYMKKYNEYKESNKNKGIDLTDYKLSCSGYTLEELREIEEYSIIEKSKALRREL